MVILLQKKHSWSFGQNLKASASLIFLVKSAGMVFFFIILEKLSPFSAPLAAEVLPNGLINVIYFQCNYLI